MKFKIRQGFPFEMNHLLLSGELDFSFVDSFAMDKGIKTDPVYDEVLELCIAKHLNHTPKNTNDVEFYEQLPYVDYQEEQSVLSMWIKHHTTIKHPDLDVRVYVMDAQAVGKMITLGVGAGVLPGHLVNKLNRSGAEINVIKGSNKPLINMISIAHLEEKTLTPASKATLEFLKEHVKGTHG